MGWYYTDGATRKDVIDELTKEQTRPNGGYFKTIKKCTAGNVLWCVHESGSNDGERSLRWIGCYLLDNGGRHDGWGYKPMDESMGPFYFSCPLSYLELAPVANEKWREGVRQYWAERKAKRRQRRITKAQQAFYDVHGRLAPTDVEALRYLRKQEGQHRAR